MINFTYIRFVCPTSLLQMIIPLREIIVSEILCNFENVIEFIYISVHVKRCKNDRREW